MSKISKIIFNNAKHIISSKFGYRKPIKINNKKSSTFHKGTDYATYEKKINQYAIEEGKIISCGEFKDGTKYVYIKYNRLNKRFERLHLDTINVKKNQLVNKGTLIGTTGKTGNATGIHLHLGIYDLNSKTYIDPEKYSKIFKEKTYYMVKKNDTLYKIGKKYNIDWKIIYKNNKKIIGKNPDLIKIGQKLYIK